MRHHNLRNLLLEELGSVANVEIGNTFALSKEKSKHLIKVLRIEWNEKVRVVDGKGKAYLATLIEESEHAMVRVEKLLSEQNLLPLELVICLPKNATMDSLIERAVECGVTKIIPVVSMRSVVRVDASEKNKYVLRWKKIMDEAVEQSERSTSAHVEAPITWKEFLKKNYEIKNRFAFISELREAGDNSEITLFRETFEKLKKVRSEAVQILIGPEGGLTVEEQNDLKQAGFSAASLGENILRVETAVTSALSMVQLSRVP